MGGSAGQRERRDRAPEAPRTRPAHRWWAYQRERLPLGRTSVVAAALAMASVTCSSLLRHQSELPPPRAYVVAFGLSAGFFALVRVADEHADHRDDARLRPNLPVPRGLVTLPELRRAAVAVVAAQAVLAVALSPALLPLLAAAWAFLALMAVEFFVPAWLRARPLAVLTSHMVVLAVVTLCATACDWVVAGSAPGPGLGWFLVMSYCSGLVVEVGRKLRAPGDAEAGVSTYTTLYGPRRAGLLWLGTLVAAFAAALVTAGELESLVIVGSVLAVVVTAGVWALIRFRRRPAARAADAVRRISEVWLLVAYLSLACGPLIGRRPG